MLVNIRIVLTPNDDPTGYDRFFCYEGNNFQTLMLAIGAASQWDGALDSEPFGWTKNGQTGEIRRPHVATPQPSITCPRCQRTSYSLKDIEEGYCGACHDWTAPR